MKKTIIFLLFIVSIGRINAQRLINPIDSKDIFTEQQLTSFEKFSKIDSRADIQWVQIGNIEEAIDEDAHLSFTVPGREEIFRFKITRNEIEDENNFVIAAENQNEDGEPTGEEILVVSIDGYKAATILLGKDSYRILPIDESNQIILKPQADSPVWCSTENTPEQTNIIEECGKKPIGCTANIMYVVDADKNNATFLNNKAIYALCKLWTEEINTSFLNSKITHRVKLVWVEFMKDNIFLKDCDTQSMQTYFFNNNIFNTFSPLNSIIKQINPDITVFLSKNKAISSCDLWGIAQKIKPMTSGDSFIVVDFDAALNHKTVVHEVGHLYGGRHESDGGNAPGRAIKVGSNITMMYSVGSNTFMYFSNPDIKVGGSIIGSKDRNNACVIQNYGCTIANLAKDETCNTIVDGNFDKICNPSILNIVVPKGPLVAACSNLSYSYEYSIDGKNFTKVLNASTNQCTIKLASNKKDYTVYVRVKVYSGLNLVDQAYSSFPTKCVSSQSN